MSKKLKHTPLVRSGFAFVAMVLFSVLSPAQDSGQNGGFVPGQKRAAADPAQLAKGKTLYQINCRGCHGADLRGGDMGGPNLLRSQVALSDVNGELIVPIIHGGRKAQGMPAIPLNDADANAVAAYVRSIVGQIQVQGAPPSAGKEPPSILVGNAQEGKAFYNAKCASCHSNTSEMAQFVTKFKDMKKMQAGWIAGGTEEDFAGPAALSDARAAKATVALPDGQTLEGKILHIDEFLVSVRLPDGSERTVARNGDTPSVTVKDPMAGHRDLLPEYTNKDVHDVTAYLVTLK